MRMKIKSELNNNINTDRFKRFYREELGKSKVDINKLNARLNLTKKQNILKDVKLFFLLVSLISLVMVSISVFA